MSALMTIRGGLVVGIVTLALFVETANAQRMVSIEKMSFKVVGAFDPGAAVSGELRIPDSTRDRLPAVLILHSSPGFDGRGAFYAEALNQAGIATVEIDYLQGRGIPATPRHNMPHAYETLQYLASHLRIDQLRIGIMRFSWGGIHRTVLAGTAKSLKPTIYHRVTGSPVHILTGDKDDYDDPDSCPKFLAELPAQVRPHFSLTVYNKAEGGIIKVIANPDIANRSREFAVAYFRRNLAAD